MMPNISLNDFTREDPKYGLVISASSVRSPISMPTRLLKYYSSTEETDIIIANNREWAKTQNNAPRFQFIYLMLPTPCNQRCQGCFMGQDKSRLPDGLNGPYWQPKELDNILEVAKDYGVKAVVYGGGGELFMWAGAFSFIERVVGHGLGMVIFTNGSLLSPDDIAHLNDLGVVLIVSLRDTIEAKHNALVGRSNFRKSIRTIEESIKLGMNNGRLAIEMPVTLRNEHRVLNDLLPVCRALGIVPWIEEFIQISASGEERAGCHNFAQARSFFQQMSAKDAELGISWTSQYGQRMVDQPQCRRALYSFAVFPSGDVLDCPSHSRLYGNMRQTSLEQIICSEEFRQAQLSFKYCPCSTFYTAQESDIPQVLPAYLEELR